MASFFLPFLYQVASPRVKHPSAPFPSTLHFTAVSGRLPERLILQIPPLQQYHILHMLGVGEHVHGLHPGNLVGSL